MPRHLEGTLPTRLNAETAGPTSSRPTSPCGRNWTSSPTSAPCAFPPRESTGPSSARTPRTCMQWGARASNVTDDLGIDFRVITSQGSERIIEAAFAHAKRTGKDNVTIVTKANIVKTTDGKFLDIARKVAENYPGISWEGWYIDIMTAALINPRTPEAVPGAGAPQPVRRHPHRRGCPDTGRRRHRRKRQRGQALRHVRGHPRLGPPDGEGEPGPVRRPQLHDEGRGPCCWST